jgi:hypothetical protein
MAIHKTVLRTADGRLRITANPAGTRFDVERDMVFTGRFTSLAALQTWLAEQGIDLADLIED